MKLNDNSAMSILLGIVSLVLFTFSATYTGYIVLFGSIIHLILAYKGSKSE